MRPLATLFLLCLACNAPAQLLELKSGHLKGQYVLATYPSDSLLRELIDTPSHDLNADARILINGRQGGWSWQADYQLNIRSGDSLELTNAIGTNFLVPNSIIEDDRRLWDLTHVISEDENRVVSHRLDRLTLSYTGEKVVLRGGRQAVSWGNGLFYNPVDFFNPFDPAAVDREYKTGDDMLYGQYLQDSGNDWQMVSVWRRDENGDLSSDVNSNAIKYHAFVGEHEIDLLLAEHYDDTLASVGGVASWGGAIVRGDLVFTHTNLDDYISAVTNLSYSWSWGGKNMTGVLEYFYNGLGLGKNDYDNIAKEPDLVARLTRGELFTLGKQYLAAGLTVEITPLVNVTPNVFFNLLDNSGLAQVVTQYDLEQNVQLLFALNLPFGADGTEFGGLDTSSLGIPSQEKQLSNGPGLFLQLAYFF